MKKIIITLLLLCGVVSTYAKPTYGARLCESSASVHCITIHRGQSWSSLWPNPADRNLVQRLNRMNIALYRGVVIAVPNNMNITLADIAPFRSQIGSIGEKQIIIDPKLMAWAAYDPNGTLVKWGPASSARGFCPDVHRRCTTPAGSYRITRKSGSGCISKKFPIPNGGAKMPFCMFFYNGFAMHGSSDVPGFNASHGCVRLLKSDAQWLNQNFVKVPGEGSSGTKSGG